MQHSNVHSETMRKTQAAQHAELYHAAVSADEAWHAELVKAFGKRAGDRRYDSDKSGHPMACRLAHAVWQQANEAWIAKMVRQ